MPHADAVTLAIALSDISEKAFCAEWIIDLEYNVWKAVADQVHGLHFGRHFLSKHDLDRLFRLYTECGGWVYYNDDSGPTWIDADAWQSKYQLWVASEPEPR